MGVVQMSRGVLAPASPHLLSEVAIIARLANAFHAPGHPVPWRWLAEDHDRIRSLIERVVTGFENYSGRAQATGGFYLPNAAKQRVWDTPQGEAVFSVESMDVFEVFSPGRLVLQTLRSHDQFNTTIYGMNDRYRRIVLVNPDDLKERGIMPCSQVAITSFWGDERRIARDFTAIPL